MSTRYGAARDASTLARRRRAYVALRTHYGAHTAEAVQALGIAPVTARQSAEARALQVCRQVCPVIRECLRHAHAAPEITGIWGGATPTERALQKETAPVRTGAA